MARRTQLTPNTRLASLLDETGYRQGEFARLVNRVGTETGRPLRYDQSAVSHWLSGATPMPRTQPVVLEALARKLGRQVTAFDAGFTQRPAPPAQQHDTVVELSNLGSADMDPSRRAVLAAGLFSAAVAIPGWPEMADRFEQMRTDPHARIGMPEVESVRTMTERISDLDDQFGGRATRPMAAAFLVNQIVPYLRADATDEVRRAMLSAAADHCYLTGYMAMDERADRLAQDYYVKALELAGAADDHLTYCTTLRGMSVQAVDLGHAQMALRLADAAAAATPQAGPRMLAFLAGQQAHAAAATGDRATAMQRIAEAENAMDRAESQAKAFGSYDPSSLSYHVGQVRHALGDRVGGIEALQQSDRQRESVFRRTRIRYNAMLAERKLQIGHLEEACADWHRVLDDYPLVQSGRCDDRIRELIHVTRPYGTNAHVRHLHERLRAVVAPGALS